MDKTRLSCLVDGANRVLSWWQSLAVSVVLNILETEQCVQFHPRCERVCKHVLTQFPNDLVAGSRQDKTLFETEQDWKELNMFSFEMFLSPTLLICRQFCLHHWQGQDSLVSSVSAVTTRHNTTQAPLSVTPRLLFLHKSGETEKSVT